MRNECALTGGCMLLQKKKVMVCVNLQEHEGIINKVINAGIQCTETDMQGKKKQIRRKRFDSYI